MIYPWKWRLADLDPPAEDAPKVFSCFACGGGSTMGYKRAGFKVVGNVEIDPRIAEVYTANHHPLHSYIMDIRDFNKLREIPEDLKDLDVLDGSPPCSTFSMAGSREEAWGKKKQFREGQAEQTLDDLFMVFLDTVEKLRPKVVVAENVEGMLRGNARGYVAEILDRFQALGYQVQLFKLNARDYDVPQERERIFFIANRMGYPKLTIPKSETPPIPFGEVRTPHGIPYPPGSKRDYCARNIIPGDKNLGDVTLRLFKKETMFNLQILYDEKVAKTLTANASTIRFCDKTQLSNGDMINISSFPQDYNFGNQKVGYICGMSVPPSLMAHVAHAIKEQWLDKEADACPN